MGAPNAAITKHCINCGNNMAEESNVSLAHEREAKTPPPPPPPKKSSPVGMIIVAVLVVVGLIFFLGNSCTSAAKITVTGHSWKQVVTVEEYKKVRESDWKKNVPSAAG